MFRYLLLSVACLAAAVCRGEVKVSYPVTMYNFGAFSEESGPVSCLFPVVNTGDEPLAIIAARATCGCTQPRYPREPIAPGDTAFVSVTYDPNQRPGRFNKQVYVETNANPPKQRLDIKGTVIGAPATVARRYPASFGPLMMEHPAMMMGDVLKNEFKTAYFNGYNRGTDSLSVTAVSTPPYIKMMASPEVAPPGEQVTLVAFVEGAKCPDYGLVEDSIVISLGGREQFAIPFTLIVSEDFSKMSAADKEKAPVLALEGDRLDFGHIDRHGAPVSARLKIGNTGRSTLEVRRIYSAEPGITVSPSRLSIKKGQSAEVTVTVDPSVQKGALLNTPLLIIANDPSRPTTRIRLVGEY